MTGRQPSTPHWRGWAAITPGRFYYGGRIGSGGLHAHYFAQLLIGEELVLRGADGAEEAVSAAFIPSNTPHAIVHGTPDGLLALIDPVQAGRLPHLPAGGAASSWRFEAVTDRGVFTGDGVVVATGPFQRPRIPDLPLAPEVVALHSGDYRGPDQLPDGPVLVVGGGNSGVQIAAELATSRPVTLALGNRQPVLPQRVLGVGLFTWLEAFGLVRAPVTGRIGRLVRDRDPLIGMGPRELRRRGVRVVDRIVTADGPMLSTSTGKQVRPASVIWATGHRPDCTWLRIPGALADGSPVHAGGISPIPGLTYVGLPFQRNRGSALLGWVGHDAALVADSYAFLRPGASKNR